jgi:hypothetical protein
MGIKFPKVLIIAAYSRVTYVLEQMAFTSIVIFIYHSPPKQQG